MRHQKKRNKLSRDAGHRKALVRNLCRQVLQHERVRTTEAKAKVIKPEVDKLITLAKRGDLHARRQALATLNQDKFVVHKLFDEIAPRYAERPGGYTRILKLGPRRSDSSRDGLPRARLALSVTASGGGARSGPFGRVPLGPLPLRPSLAARLIRPLPLPTKK